MALIDAATARGFDFVLAHHETAALFMAAAEAEVTGRPGVCLATVGPGVANSINGLAHCLLDRVPVVLVSDRVEDPLTLHQLLDHQDLVRGVVKSSTVITPENAHEVTRRALEQASAPLPGPVHLDLSALVAAANSRPAVAAAAPQTARDGTGDERILDAACELLAAGQRPAVLVGLGARDPGTVAAVRAFLDTFRIPVLCTYKAKGVVPDDHACAMGLVTNGKLEARVLDAADRLLLVGFDRVELMPGEWRWKVPTVAVGEPAAGAGPIEASIVVAHEPAAALERIRLDLERRAWLPSWPDEAAAWPPPPPPDPPSGLGVSPADVVRACRRLAPVGTMATVDAGSHMFAATLFWTTSAPRRFLISNGLSTMGYGLPAAIGAALCQDAPVFCFTGDGGLAMALGELATAARLGVRVIVVVFNDGMLNLIKVKQEKLGRTTHGLDFGSLDWATAAEGLGVPAKRVADVETLEQAVAGALAADCPTLLDVRVNAGVYRDLLSLVRG